MPHQCVRCGKLYEDGTPNLLKGCTDCDGKFFFFIKKSSIEKAKKISEHLSEDDRRHVEIEVKKILEQSEEDTESPVFVDIENLRIPKAGKYEIDIVDVFNGKPIVCKIGEGKYMIDIVSAFNESMEKEKK